LHLSGVDCVTLDDIAELRKNRGFTVHY